MLSMPIGMEVLMVMDVLEREELPFPRSLPEFQRYFPDEAISPRQPMLSSMPEHSNLLHVVGRGNNRISTVQ